MSPSLRVTPTRIATVLVATCIFAFCAQYIATSFQWGPIWAMLQSVRLGWLFIVAPCTIIVYWTLRALRWYRLLSALKVDVGFLNVYRCTAVSLGLANYTPFQSGEAMKVEMLKKGEVVSRSAGYSSFAFERGLDLLTVIFLAVVSLVLGFDVGIKRSYAYGLLAALVCMVGVGVAVIRRIKGDGKVGQFCEKLCACMVNKQIVVYAAWITICSWIVVALGWQVCLYSLSIELGLGRSIGLMAVMTLTSVLSFIPGGLGVHEAGTAACLMRLGYDTASAQAGALIVRFYGLLAIVLSLFHILVFHVAGWHRGQESQETKVCNLSLTPTQRRSC